jgi:hypothetical protein
MQVRFRQRFVDGRLPVNSLFLRPMRVQFCDLLISLQRQRGTPIRYRRSAVLFAVGNNANLDLIRRERRGHDYVIYLTVLSVICREQPESIPAVVAFRIKKDAHALYNQ